MVPRVHVPSIDVRAWRSIPLPLLYIVPPKGAVRGMLYSRPNYHHPRFPAPGPVRGVRHAV